jgi:predicted transcriptional regulator
VFCLFLIILHKIDDLFKMEIRNYITTDFKAIDSQETIATVKDFLMIWLFTLPVVEEGIYIGSISSEDIENFDDDKSSWLQVYSC